MKIPSFEGMTSLKKICHRRSIHLCPKEDSSPDSHRGGNDVIEEDHL